MKRFIDSIITILINTVITVTILGICLIGFILLLSKLNGIAVEDTISYAKTFISDTNELTLNSISSTPINPNSSEQLKIQPTNITNTNNNNNNNDNNNNINNTNNRFYYNQLDSNSKIIYNALEKNINNLKKNNYIIDFSTQFNELLNTTGGQNILDVSFQSAIDAFFYDHPEVFYIDLTKISLIIKYTTIGFKTTYNVYIEPRNGINYLDDNFSSEKDVTDAILAIENVKNNISQKLPDSNDYTKALKVHDILVNSLEYDSSITNKNAHNIYGALINKKVVCEGYSKAFKYILDHLNIECILVNGTATNSSGETESHMWNYIKLDGNWYGVDVTWDDPVIIGGSLTKNIIRHDYFCKGYSTFSESHVINTTISDEGKSFRIPTLSVQNYK